MTPHFGIEGATEYVNGLRSGFVERMDNRGSTPLASTFIGKTLLKIGWLTTILTTNPRKPAFVCYCAPMSLNAVYVCANSALVAQPVEQRFRNSSLTSSASFRRFAQHPL